MSTSLVRRFMGRDLGDSRTRQFRASSTAFKGICYKGVLPFAAGLLTILLLFRAAPASFHSRQLAESDQISEADCLQKLQEHPTCNCSNGASGSNPDSQSNALLSASTQENTPPGNKPSIFLFVGVLSGRGYRYHSLSSCETFLPAAPRLAPAPLVL